MEEAYQLAPQYYDTRIKGPDNDISGNDLPRIFNELQTQLRELVVYYLYVL